MKERRKNNKVSVESEAFDEKTGQKKKADFDAKKYNGILHSVEDALKIQRKLQDERERKISININDNIL